MKRLVTFITEYHGSDPPELEGNWFFIFTTDDGKSIKVGVTLDPNFGIDEFKTLDSLIDWVDEQRLKSTQRNIDAGWVPPEDYTPPPKSLIVEQVTPVWEGIFGAST